VRFVIHYGPQAGFEDEALGLARRLFAHFDEQIESLTLVPIAEAEFDLVLDDRCIHSYRQSGRAPRLSDVLAQHSGSSASAVDDHDL
jgi:predicted Rdx family selenoprotein